MKIELLKNIKKLTKGQLRLLVLSAMLLLGIASSVVYVVLGASNNPGHGWAEIDDFTCSTAGKFLFSKTGSTLTCNSETDPVATAKIGTLTNNKWCISDGSKIICVTNAPITSETDPIATAKIGTLTNNKWCISDGSKIICDTNAPTGGVSGSGSLNYITQWTGGTSLGNSIIYDGDSYIGLPNYSTISFQGIASPGNNFALYGASGETVLNGPAGTHIDFKVGNTTYGRLDSAGLYSGGTVDANKVCQKGGTNCPSTSGGVYYSAASLNLTYNSGGADFEERKFCCPSGSMLSGGCFCSENGEPDEAVLRFSWPTSASCWHCRCIRRSGSGDITIDFSAVCSQ